MKKISIIFCLALVFAACSRSVSVGSGPVGGTYSVSVTNSTGSTMDVAFNDGSDHALGTVAAGRTERFIVAGAKSASISIVGHSASGRSSGPYQVSLVPGQAANVTLR